MQLQLPTKDKNYNPLYSSRLSNQSQNQQTQTSPNSFNQNLYIVDLKGTNITFGKDKGNIQN
jgi:hypothetical protein